MVTLKREWSKPSTILFATECPPNETSFTFALAQAKESRANLVVLHVCNELTESSTPSAKAHGIHLRSKRSLEPLVQRARDLGICCRVEERKGIAVDEILRFVEERKVDRIVMGVHTSGPVGRLLVGSVAEAILRKANLPVTMAGPFLKGNACRDFFTRTILCAVSSHRSNEVVARFAAEIAARHRAHLVLQRVIAPQEYKAGLVGRTLDQIEAELLEMIPASLRAKLRMQAMAVIGDPTDELLYQGRVLQANLIVMGAHDATHFAAVSNSSIVYKVLAYAPCPVITLSPVVLADYGPVSETYRSSENNYMAGVV
jgi:nucleotide-binding universal stress UspA family protein